MGYKVFLSYRRADTEVATKLYQELGTRGRSVFFDTDALTSGDFEEKILANIKDCIVFVSLLTTESLRRMYENADTDMVRREIEAAKQEGKPKLFFMLLDDPATQKGQLYDTLNAYQSDSLFVWLARQNIIECQAQDADSDGVRGIRGVADKVTQALDGEWQGLKFSVYGDDVDDLVDFIYNGPVYDGGAAYDGLPYGIGQAEEVSSRQEHLLYEGIWEYGRSGHGKIYTVDLDEKRRLFYSGHWDSNLRPDDTNGSLYNALGNLCFQGRFDHGKPVYGTYREGQNSFYGRVSSSPQHSEQPFNPFLEIEPYIGQMSYANGAFFEGSFYQGTCCHWFGNGECRIPWNGFTLVGRGSFGSPGLSKCANVAVRFDDGEEPVTLIPSGQYFLPYTNALNTSDSDGDEFYYLDGTKYRGKWFHGAAGWKKTFPEGTIEGKFYNAEGEEFTPTEEQLKFYHAQGMALLAPLRDFDPAKTAEELENGPRVPRSLEEFRKLSSDPAESKGEPDNAMDELENNMYGQEDFTEEVEHIAKLCKSTQGEITLKRILDAMGEDSKRTWKLLPNKAARIDYIMINAPYLALRLDGIIL